MRCPQNGILRSTFRSSVTRPPVPAPPGRTLVGIRQSLPRARGRWREAPDEVPAKRNSPQHFSKLSDPASCPASGGTHAVRDSLAFLFACGRREKKSRYSPVCALVHAHAAGMCGHDSNPNSVAKEGHPEWDGPLLARCKGFEPLTFWSVARRSIQLS